MKIIEENFFPGTVEFLFGQNVSVWSEKVMDRD